MAEEAVEGLKAETGSSCRCHCHMLALRYRQMKRLNGEGGRTRLFQEALEMKVDEKVSWCMRAKTDRDVAIINIALVNAVSA